MKKNFLILILIICIVMGSCFGLINHARNQIDYERPENLSPDAIVILFIDSLNEMNLKKANSFFSKDKWGTTILRDGKREIKQIETISETETEAVLIVEFYKIRRPYLRPEKKERIVWTFVLERNGKDSEWMITQYGEG